MATESIRSTPTDPLQETSIDDSEDQLEFAAAPTIDPLSFTPDPEAVASEMLSPEGTSDDLAPFLQKAFDEGYTAGAAETWGKLLGFLLDGSHALDPRLSAASFYRLCAESCLKRAREAAD